MRLGSVLFFLGLALVSLGYLGARNVDMWSEISNLKSSNNDLSQKLLDLEAELSHALAKNKELQQQVNIYEDNLIESQIENQRLIAELNRLTSGQINANGETQESVFLDDGNIVGKNPAIIDQQAKPLFFALVICALGMATGGGVTMFTKIIKRATGR